MLQRLELRSLDKHVFLQNLSTYYTRKILDDRTKDNKLKIIAPTRNDKFEFSRQFLFSVRYSRLYQSTTHKPSYSYYINIINNRLVLNVKDGYRLKLQTPETIKLFGSTKKLIDKSQNGENVPRLEVV